MAVIIDTWDTIAPGDAFSNALDYTGVPDRVMIVGALVAIRRYQWDTQDLTTPPAKVITTTNVAGTGQITNAGSVGADGKWHVGIRVDFTAADTTALIPGVTYHYRVECTLADNTPHTLEIGAWPMASGGRSG